MTYQDWKIFPKSLSPKILVREISLLDSVTVGDKYYLNQTNGMTMKRVIMISF
jgi:hypothetical protein